MTTKIHFLGMAGYEIISDRHRILIDPFLGDSPHAPMRHEELERPDVILVTHAAYDHLGDTAAIAARAGAPVVCGGDVKAVLLEAGIPEAQIHPTVWGIVVEVGGVIVRPVESHHWSQTRLKNGQYVSGVPMGFIVEPEPGVRIYHCGDTAIFGDMKLIAQLYKPTVGLMGCANSQALLARANFAGKLLTGEMSPYEAALASEFLGLKLAIASHYLDLTNETERGEVEQFLAAVPECDTTGARQAMYMEVGETIELNGDSVLVRRGVDRDAAHGV
ncbi:L-ascorbate metabolism protein UlaG (beta-lactamase superfamily) [Paenibacillus taihuensis]|uniref:L-ascorbate metabolism protein UlaG (Beta-lactamase superfamily) n=1 Tax=Paenibacillus taihuensis TaxID=1156355 RepID=A0A3D9S9T1_9BACL|nr:MBL fold metallo-hydrolase [Paenibacillus taihuensis]REE86200.1 L-ascorbate metabolism protein UlaG (beta-lactamase superfamily) [Paenibacillus taihuensis]